MSAARNTILIVDDEPDIVNLTEKFLKLGDFDTITSNNAKEAMKMVEENYNRIALILLDIMMPGRSGYSVLEEIKNSDRYKDILVVLFTVKSFNEDVQKGKKLGADAYITKPFSGKDLLKRIKDILEKKI
ncbi:MAG: response regulator [Candidatus Lokiarchaeota archaeon]|nr:response regulator [Candidatus Lokiarchaeota archaeon]